MQFDVVVGNPPYQMEDGGHCKSAQPLYHRFVQVSKTMPPRYMAFIIPARWYAAGKVALNDFRAEMLADRRMARIVDYESNHQLFPGVVVAGGFCIFLWAHDYDGDCLVVPDGDLRRAVFRRLDELDVFVRDEHSMEIVRKVQRRMREAGLQALSGAASARNPFGIPAHQLPPRAHTRPSVGRDVMVTDPFGIRAHELPPDAAEGPSEGRNVLLMTRDGDRYIRRDQVPRKRGWIDRWKVVASRAAGSSYKPDKTGRRRALATSRVLPPGSACTESYLVVGVFPDEASAEHALTTLRTRFSRFMMSQLLLTQNVPRKCYTFVPAMPADRAWTDEDLAEFFDLTGDDVSYMESKISEYDISLNYDRQSKLGEGDGEDPRIGAQEGNPEQDDHRDAADPEGCDAGHGKAHPRGREGGGGSDHGSRHDDLGKGEADRDLDAPLAAGSAGHG